MDALLNRLYYNYDSPCAYSAVKPLLFEARKVNKKITAKQVQHWLNQQRTYSIHRIPIRKFKRNITLSSGLHCDHQIDIADLKSLRKYNRGYSYIFSCVDILSRQAWAFPLKKKDADEVVDAYKQVLEVATPYRCYSDAGREFVNKKFAHLLTRYRVRHYIPESSVHLGCVERFNRTIKTKIWRALYHKGTRNWVSILRPLLEGYNRRPHSTIGMAPHIVFRRLYGDRKLKHKFKFDIGASVRIAQEKPSIFTKGYKQQFSPRVYKIIKQIPGDPVIYRISQLEDDDPLPGVYYEKEITSAGNDIHVIDRVVRSVVEKGKRWFLVRFVNDKRVYWVREEDIDE
jgi:hypothetical protein